ncbi:MerR family transcriptional regulator [Gleimia sp. 6138-11-ORH1]|uniref:MerR family transcriptional regulator n=1 Tax=Gleimia sp. 6138-11-ORH1 TaxID=2973937 RepID=UPI00216A1FE3|nr:MerR family transcriptional regulator [Gleimia sp. 6138-11-ORH1]MCS4483914.1 MerR family transcriptional regulator [Gleimia sp. 6138-11-ORH1]
MPRPDLTTNLSPAPLTLTAVSQKLGVSASTLRTWERRYGLGPEREIGAHRRYSVSEFELIQTVVELVRSGISPADACQSVRNAAELYKATHQTVGLECLIRHTEDGNYTALHADLDILITRDGILRTWTDFIQPALVKFQTDPDGETPGISPRALLAQVTLQVVREIAERAENKRAIEAKLSGQAVVVVSDEPRSLLAHIIGVSLTWEGINARLLPALLPVTQLHPDVPNMVERTRKLANKIKAQIAVIVGSSIHNAEYLKELENTELQLVLVGPTKVSYLPANATQMRSAGACVDEIIAHFRGY